MQGRIGAHCVGAIEDVVHECAGIEAATQEIAPVKAHVDERVILLLGRLSLGSEAGIGRAWYAGTEEGGIAG